MIIAVDFDGVCTTHEYPRIGKDIGAVPVLKRLVEEGHQLMLWTMRGSLPYNDKNTLFEAVNWFKENDIPLWNINENPEQRSWTDSNKQYAELYIDDAALGCPLIYPKTDSFGNLVVGLRPYVDWVKVEEMLMDKNILKRNLFFFKF